jgi:hypothetical protein
MASTLFSPELEGGDHPHGGEITSQVVVEDDSRGQTKWLRISRRCTLAFRTFRGEIVTRRGFFALVAGRKLLVNAGR